MPRYRCSSSMRRRKSLPRYGEEMVVEVKTRGPEAFKRWRTLGAERSHPAAVQPKPPSTPWGTYRGNEGRRHRHHGHGESGPGTTRSSPPTGWSGPCRAPAGGWSRWSDHHALHGPDPDTLPDRDFYRRQLAVPVAVLSWTSASRVGKRIKGRESCEESRGATGGDRRGGTGGGDGLYGSPAGHEGNRIRSSGPHWQP